MDKSRTLIHITLALCFLALILALVDFGAFTDIYHDFMGTRVPELLDISVSGVQLERTSTGLEWAVARFSWIVRIAILMICIGLLFKLNRGLEKGR
ncbi:MAG: hypothetical protein WBB73_11855 [Candidatus Aminicenantaceae bacterium]